MYFLNCNVGSNDVGNDCTYALLTKITKRFSPLTFTLFYDSKENTFERIYNKI